MQDLKDKAGGVVDAAGGEDHFEVGFIGLAEGDEDVGKGMGIVVLRYDPYDELVVEEGDFLDALDDVEVLA